MRICVLGATGLVGRETLTLIRRAWPDADVSLFASRDQQLRWNDADFDVKRAAALESNDAPRGDLAFVALDDEHSKRYVPRLVELGYRVVDKSNTYRMDPAVPLVAAGVNAELVSDDVRLVANPNCTTIPLMLGIQPLRASFGLTSVRASTYQAISGAGLQTLERFTNDASAAFGRRNDLLGLSLDPNSYVGNTVPHAGGTDDSGFSSEERKLMRESKKILQRTDLEICAQCCRVPVAVGHYINAWVELETPARLEDLRSALRRGPFLRTLGEDAMGELSALHALQRRDSVLIGRLRMDPADPASRTVCLTITADNVRLGAATNAVRIASRWFPVADESLRA